MLRIGTLGSSRISQPALILPAESVPEVTVAAVAARDLARAEAYALRHGLERAYGSYEELLADPDIDAVYNPLPNSLHGPWTLRAIEAGKHVLCEKPFASNADEAARVAQAASASGLVVMEAMHYRYHPLTQRLTEVVGEFGPVRHIQAWTSFAITNPGDIRYDYGLAGGALMDGGCYALDCLRLLGAGDGPGDGPGDGQGEPSVTGALADPVDAGAGAAAADRSLAVRLAFPGGATGWFESTFTRDGEFRADLHVICEDGLVHLDNFIFPLRGRLTATRDGAVVADEEGGGESTYVYQLRAFAAAIASGDPVPTSAQHAAVTMRLIDDAYRAAGLAPRPAERRG
ncbi:MAG TPA: Gfo/Idh/MocA family oxidoreductase [Streptosporangiaceae bacterium]|nr:Gfo/Idh/MocA family oxidoreductase [Streptosporangiaceae bacterium]